MECGTGDDRWLAMRALLRGQVVGVYEAGVETDMPATLRGTFRQRLRWARSWWWMLPFAYARLTPPTTFGVFLMPKAGLPGSIRSGEKASEKSRPAVRPDPFSSSGRATSSVVPG